MRCGATLAQESGTTIYSIRLKTQLNEEKLLGALDFLNIFYSLEMQKKPDARPFFFVAFLIAATGIDQPQYKFQLIK